MDEDVEAGPSSSQTGSESKPEEKKKPEVKKEPEEEEKKKPVVKKSSSAKKSSSGVGARPSGSVRRIVEWKIDRFCDWNFWYLLRMRGIMNIIHLGLSVALLFLLGHACQLRPAKDKPSEGFFCKPPEVFLFLTSCAALFNSTLYLFCCIMSKRTDSLLFQTSLEIGYYILYFLLFLAASIGLLISIIHWGADRIFFNSDYATLQTIAIIGLVTGSCYGISTLWYFVSHQFYTSEIIIENNQVVGNQIVPNEDEEGNPVKKFF